MDLTRDQIKAVNDLRIEPVAVPEWGGKVYVKMLTGAARDEFEASRSEARKEDEDLAKQYFRAMFVQATCCDAGGSLLFTEEDWHWLAQKSGAALDRIFEATGKLNHFFASDIETLAKNSRGARNESSGTP